MDPILNPYLPGAGAQPPELTGRQELLEQARITLGRTRLRRPTKSFIAIGLRGVGKTVLLQRIRAMADSEKFETCFFEAHEHATLPELLIPQARRLILDLDRLGALNEQVKRGLRVLKSFMSRFKLSYADMEIELDISPEAGAADSGNLEADLPELLIALGRAAAARNTSVAMFIDEMQFLTERDLAALIMALHRCVQDALPIVLIAAGLPQTLILASKSKSYAERSLDFPEVGPLSREDAYQALRAPAENQHASWTPEALARAWSDTAGYPYFLQEWGYHAWNASAGPEITGADVERASAQAIKQLDENFFRIRFGRLTPGERNYLRAMAALGPGPHRSVAVAQLLGARVTALSTFRTRLIEKGMIYSPAHGDIAFSVPLFDRFLQRIMPEWIAPRPSP